MIILGIESSCDETAAAILEGPAHFDSQNPSELKLLSNVVVSQIDIFKAYGGVIPEVAARSHLEAIMPVIHQAFQDADFPPDDWSKIDAIAVTHTPGLLGSLLVGTLTARTLAILHQKPLYAVHHLKSHIYANWLEQSSLPTFPLLALVISGGHTQIIYMREHNHFEIIGTTHDDAVGESFDKTAKILGLPYPGGPAVSKAAIGQVQLAETNETITLSQPGDPNAYHFPHPQAGELDFSFSGLKTAFLRTVQKICNVPISHPSADLKNLLNPQQIADLSASFEQTAVDILLEKLQKALELHPDAQSLVFAGGVSANQKLRSAAIAHFSQPGPLSQPVFFPAPRFSGDNGAMVAIAAYFEAQSQVQPTDPYSLNIMPRSVIR